MNDIKVVEKLYELMDLIGRSEAYELLLRAINAVKNTEDPYAQQPGFNEERKREYIETLGGGNE